MIYRVAAVVLSVQRSREADKTVVLFTRELGRVTGRAVSAAKPCARLAAWTEPFAEGELSLYLREGAGWGKLVGGRPLRTFPTLLSNLERATAASWVCELVQRLTPDRQPNAEKYDLLLETLSRLETAEDLGVVRLAFAARFLMLAGFMDLEASRQSTRERLERQVGAILLDLLPRPLAVNAFRQQAQVVI